MTLNCPIPTPIWDAKAAKLVFKGKITPGITEPTAVNAGQWFAVPHDKIDEFEEAFGIQSSSSKTRKRQSKAKTSLPHKDLGYVFADGSRSLDQHNTNACGITALEAKLEIGRFLKDASSKTRHLSTKQ